MTPGWRKVRRELVRISQQLQTIPEAIWEPVAQRRHDASFDTFPVYPGEISPSPRMAIYLIWQPNGLPASVLETCRHLRAKGYAVLVVSNAPLSDGDRSKLLPDVWAVLERPNYGYDFGGYRDGLRYFRKRSIEPQRLVILNDSVWYPLRPDDTLLEDAEAADADVVGTVPRHRGEERFLESYFYSIRGTVLTHPAFEQFWQQYRLTSNKYKVIRLGERGFSKAMRAAGLSVRGLYTEAAFADAIADADTALLRRILAYAAFVDPEPRQQAEQLSRTGSEIEMRAFILESIISFQFYSTYPVAAAGLLRHPVLKKSREPVSAAWREAFLRAVGDEVLPPPLPTVLSEAQIRIAEGTR